MLEGRRQSYADYETWRNGDLAHLDAALSGDPEHVRQQLAAAAQYLQDRGWRSDSVRYDAWPHKTKPTTSGSAARQLRFSANPSVDACFGRSHRKPPDHPQLDFFTESPVTCLVNGEAGPMDQLLGCSIPYRIGVGAHLDRKVFTLQTLPACDEPFGDSVAMKSV
jgi:hypothetical protein